MPGKEKFTLQVKKKNIKLDGKSQEEENKKRYPPERSQQGTASTSRPSTDPATKLEQPTRGLNPFIDEGFMDPLYGEGEKEIRFRNFNKTSVPYRAIVNKSLTHDVHVHALVHKNVDDSKPLPVMVKFHGGGGVTGSALFPGWYAQYLLEMQEQTNMFTFAPNYRLLPDATGSEQLDDIDKWWDWFWSNESDAFAQANFNVKLDKSRVCVVGESHGCMLAFHSMLTQSLGNNSNIKALFLQYPLLCNYSRPGEQNVYRGKEINSKDIKPNMLDYLKECDRNRATDKAQEESDADPPNRMVMAFALAVTGLWGRAWATDTMDVRLQKMDKTSPANFPHLYIFHGENDVHVPLADTQKVVSLLREKWPDLVKSKIHFTPVPGEEHAFDYDIDINGNGANGKRYPWLPLMLQDIQNAWIGPTSK